MKIWIRVSGPEIQSGVAVPSSPDSSCSYHYDLHPLPQGNYTLDMKLLSVFDDGQEWDFAQCNHEQGTYWDPANSTLLIYKFPISYTNSDTKLCCDQYTDHPNCMAYTSNPTKNQIGEVDYPCIFYSEVSGEKLKGGKTSSGTSRSKDHVMKYLGCGHSHVFETCREAGEDDALYLIEKEFFVSGEVGVEEEKKANLFGYGARRDNTGTMGQDTSKRLRGRAAAILQPVIRARCAPDRNGRGMLGPRQL